MAHYASVEFLTWQNRFSKLVAVIWGSITGLNCHLQRWGKAGRILPTLSCRLPGENITWRNVQRERIKYWFENHFTFPENKVLFLLTWYVQIAEAVSCSAGNDVASLSSTLDISDATPCPCRGSAERSYTWRPDGCVVDNYSFGKPHQETNKHLQLKSFGCPDLLGSCVSLQWRWHVLVSAGFHTGWPGMGLWGKHTPVPFLWYHWTQNILYWVRANTHTHSQTHTAVAASTCCCRRTWWRCFGCCASGCPLSVRRESPSVPAHRSPSAPGRTSGDCARWDTGVQRKDHRMKNTATKITEQSNMHNTQQPC